MNKFACEYHTPYNPLMTPPFSWSRQTMRFQQEIHPSNQLINVLTTLPTWGSKWIASRLWGWTLQTSDHVDSIQFIGQHPFLGRMRLNISWGHTPPHVMTTLLIFDPYSVVGVVYWFTLLPVHKLVFPLLFKEIIKRSTT